MNDKMALNVLIMNHKNKNICRCKSITVSSHYDNKYTIFILFGFHERIASCVIPSKVVVNCFEV